jgi:hypothetical protein
MNYSKSLSKINHEQGLFVFLHGKGKGSFYTCLGFDVCNDRASKLAKELNRLDLIPTSRGDEEALGKYDQALELARVANRQTGWRSQSELTPELIGLEGCRVEVVDCYGEKRRFWVGKSTGHVPCHLEIARRTSSGGPAVGGSPFKSVHVVSGERRAGA